MSIYDILKGGVFDPKHIEAMGQAFEAVCSGLELTNHDDPLRDLVARKVIAQRGEMRGDGKQSGYEEPPRDRNR
jgi:hypothetical protein